MSYHSGSFIRTIKCVECNKQYRGDVRTVNKLMKLHMKIVHKENMKKLEPPNKKKCNRIMGRGMNHIPTQYNPNNICHKQYKILVQGDNTNKRVRLTDAQIKSLMNV